MKFWEDQNDAPFPMDRLKKVTVRSFHGRISEIKFIEFVMANSPILEELSVESVTNPEFEEDEMKAVLQLHCQVLTQFKFIGGNYESSSDDMSDSDDNSVGSYSSDYYD